MKKSILLPGIILIFSLSFTACDSPAGGGGGGGLQPPGDGDFTISLEGADIQHELTGPTISLGAVSAAPSRIAIINPAQFDAGSIRWFMGGEEIPRANPAVSGAHGQYLALDSSLHGDMIGTYRVTVEVRRGGTLHSAVIVFSVTL
jgi:hypothetical protein